MIQIKQGADVRNLRREVWEAVYLFNEIMAEYGLNAVITSGNDSKHGRKSLHYLDYAVDLRTRDIKTQVEKVEITQKFRACLGERYDVLLEHNHIHAEFDPRGVIHAGR